MAKAKITAARKPGYAREDKTAIDVEIKVEKEWIPFTATLDDPEEYGRLIFEKAETGEFGKVAAYKKG